MFGVTSVNSVCVCVVININQQPSVQSDTVYGTTNCWVTTNTLSHARASTASLPFTAQLTANLQLTSGPSSVRAGPHGPHEVMRSKVSSRLMVPNLWVGDPPEVLRWSDLFFMLLNYDLTTLHFTGFLISSWTFPGNNDVMTGKSSAAVLLSCAELVSRSKP